jgi:hypothetical protein
MYYLRKEPYESTISEIRKTDGTIIPEKKYTVEDRAVYKHYDFSRFYRKPYPGKHKGLKLYQVKRLKTILENRKLLFEYCGEWFDVYNENGKLEYLNGKWVEPQTTNV